ncbi:MAG: CPBP family intramembrane metalloprotease [Bacteroidales bacterium]|nr:CPBP family intramembrane metalloprotease [Bacteroidales bacterium]
MKKTVFGILLATVFWFVMFSPWTSGLVNFWVAMTCAGIVLTAYAFFCDREGFGDWKTDLHNQVLLGIGIAIVLWGFFWIGDKLSQLMFSFARPQVNLIYDMKDGSSSLLIALALLFVVGPAEEFFWRGFVQRRLMARFGDWGGFFIALAAYTFIHIWSFNFMLICAAAVCGFCWGILYRIKPSLLPALVISHALWDVAAFVVFPF